MPSYPTRKLKSTLRLLPAKQGKPLSALRLAGIEPSPEMPASNYKAIVTSAEIVWKYNRNNARLFFRVLEGDFSGTSLEGWFPIDLVGEELKPGCRYHRLCKLALGDSEPDNLHPAHVFKDKVFLVSARYRRSNGKSRELEDDTVKKDSTDKLKVGTILGVAEL